MGKRGPKPSVNLDYVREHWGTMTLAEIGAHEGVSRQRIDQIRKDLGLPKLRDKVSDAV